MSNRFAPVSPIDVMARAGIQIDDRGREVRSAADEALLREVDSALFDAGVTMSVYHEGRVAPYSGLDDRRVWGTYLPAVIDGQVENRAVARFWSTDIWYVAYADGDRTSERVIAVMALPSDEDGKVRLAVPDLDAERSEVRDDFVAVQCSGYRVVGDFTPEQAASWWTDHRDEVVTTLEAALEADARVVLDRRAAWEAEQRALMEAEATAREAKRQRVRSFAAAVGEAPTTLGGLIETLTRLADAYGADTPVASTWTREVEDPNYYDRVEVETSVAALAITRPEADGPIILDGKED